MPRMRDVNNNPCAGELIFLYKNDCRGNRWARLGGDVGESAGPLGLGNFEGMRSVALRPRLQKVMALWATVGTGFGTI